MMKNIMIMKLYYDEIVYQNKLLLKAFFFFFFSFHFYSPVLCTEWKSKILQIT